MYVNMHSEIKIKGSFMNQAPIYLTIRKRQHTDHKKKEDDPTKTYPDVAIFFIIIPEILKTINREFIRGSLHLGVPTPAVYTKLVIIAAMI